MPLRLLDANVFIQAKNSYYSFDLVPAFCSWLHLQATVDTPGRLHAGQRSIGQVGYHR